MVQQDRCAMKVTTDACLFGAWLAKKLHDIESACTLLDIGTGTGLLALMIAQKTNAIIDTIEIDKDAFEQAQANIAESPWQDRVKVHHGDIHNFLFDTKYDVIVTNPPFYENELKSPDTNKNLARHQGLELSELMRIIADQLAENGEFFLMLPIKRLNEFNALISGSKLKILEILRVRQSPRHDYFRFFVRGNLTGNKEGLINSEICIMGDDNNYTADFIKLLKGYYLNL